MQQVAHLLTHSQSRFNPQIPYGLLNLPELISEHHQMWPEKKKPKINKNSENFLKIMKNFKFVCNLYLNINLSIALLPLDKE